MATAKIGRNDACPCGSGKKYKQCCEAKQQRRGRGLLVVFLVLAAAGLIAIVAGIRGYWDNPYGSQSRQVWDPTHGHYHTVP